MSEKHILNVIQAMYLRLFYKPKANEYISSLDAQVYVDYCNLLYEQDHHDVFNKEQYDMYVSMCDIIKDSPQF